MKFAGLAGWIFFGLMSAASGVYAQNNITALNAGGAGNGTTVIKVELAQPLVNLPTGFITDTPPRIVLDLLETANGLGKSIQKFNEEGVRSVNIVQVGGRTRLVINLDRMLVHNTRIDGNSLLITLQGSAVNADAGNNALPLAGAKQGAQQHTPNAETGKQIGDEAREKPSRDADVPIKNDKPAETAAQMLPEQNEAVAELSELRFDITGYTLEGATLLTQAEIDAAIAPFIGKNKDFSDVQRALEDVEEAYSSRGFSAVRVMLPEQELEKGAVRFQVLESHFGKVAVKGNRFGSKANALNAIPSLRSGGVPRTRQIARELRFANENPSRQLNVVLKSGEEDGLVDANIIVTDSEPTAWGLTLDNTGTAETGRSRFGLSFRHANLFDADHLGSLQFQTSPTHADRVAVLSGSYKIPLYRLGDSLEFTGGYSNVNSILGGLDVVKGGGTTLAAHYTHPLAKMGEFEPRLSFGLDWRKFSNIYFNNMVVSPEIVVMPLSVAYSTQGKLDKSDVGFNASLSANLPGMSKGATADFAAYNPLANAHYKVARYGANYAQLVGNDWQIRVALSGQYSSDTLIAGEQMRLGGADAVRGFSEGSAGGDSGMRWNLEGYTPNLGSGDFMVRALAFFDTGEARLANGAKSSISGAGIGLRANYTEQFSLRLDAACIINADTDLLQRVGDWRVHIGLSASF